MEGVGAVGYAEKPEPTPGPGDATIRPTVGLVCTSDVHTVHGAIGERSNLTLGHEVVGVVDAVGEGVKRFAPGDRVVVGAITPDGGHAPHRTATPRSPAGRSAGGSSPTRRTARSPNGSTSTTRTPTSPPSPTASPTRRRCTPAT
jgi:threonine dehydrogenase-like Zn-dependent dehydrogenase